MPSVTLQKAEDKATIKKALSGNKILTATVARLYVAYPDPNAWTYTKIMGAVGFVKDNSKNSFFFKVVDLLGDRGIIWEQELYKDFQYTEETPFFHTFALDEYLAAFSFANEQEAKSFYKKVINREKLPSKSKKSQKENKNAGGFFGGAKKKKKKNKIDKSDIGAPTEFRHLGHIGWDEQKGFDIQNINPEWKGLIDQLGDLGVSKEVIAQNAQFISEFLETNKKEPPKQAKKGPPPQPPSRRAAPPPPTKRKSPPPPPARRPVTGSTTPIRDALQPSSPAKINSISPPISPSFSPKISPTPTPPPPPPPPPISAPSPPHIPPTIPSRSTPQPVVAPPPPPPLVRPPTFNNTPPPIPPARVTPAPPPLPPTRQVAPPTTPLPPPSTGGPPPPPPPPPSGGPPPPPPPPPSGGPPPPPPPSGGPPPPPPPPPPSEGPPPPPPPPTGRATQPPPPLPAGGAPPPQPDTRSNLMEAIRNRGGFSGAGLRSVGEPVRQSTFTEEPSSPTGNDNNLAKTLADALKKLNKDMGSDESDDDDDEWDTE